MSQWFAIETFLEPAARARASKLLEIWKLARTCVATSKLTSFKVRSSALGSWWVCSVEGEGVTTIAGDMDAVSPPNYILITLALTGLYQAKTGSPLVSRADTISLHRWRPELLRSLTTWGAFRYVIFYLPAEEVEGRQVDVSQVQGTSICASTGSGAVLCACLKAFAEEVFRGDRIHSLTLMQNEIMNLVLRAVSTGDAPSFETRKSAFEAVSNYIDDHLSDSDLCPKRIASLCNLSERQFYRLFEGRGETFSRFVRRLRVQRAAHILHSGEISSITSVAYDCGFSSPSHFGRSFREHFGIDPSNFRLLKLANADPALRHEPDDGRPRISADAATGGVDFSALIEASKLQGR